MPTKKPQQMTWLQTNTLRVSRAHFLYVLILAATVIVYDAWKLITPQSLAQRWLVVMVMLFSTTVIWYLARTTRYEPRVYSLLIGALIALDIFVAGFNVYHGRGMASRAVLLFCIPIVTSAVLLNRSAIYATSALCAGTYSYAIIKYFTDHPSEGYKVELYGDLIMYTACFFLIASILWILVSSVQKTTK